MRIIVVVEVALGIALSACGTTGAAAKTQTKPATAAATQTANKTAPPTNFGGLRGDGVPDQRRVQNRDRTRDAVDPRTRSVALCASI